MKPPTTPYFSSHTLSRREFLQSLLALATGGWMLGAMETLAAAAPRSYFCAVELKTGRRLGDDTAPVPAGRPGSIMKLVAAAALVEDRLISLNERLECRGQIVRHGSRFLCQKAHGSLTLVEALGHSCNVFFVQAAERLAVGRLLAMASCFGLDQPVSGPQGGLFPKTAASSQTPLLVLGLDPALQPTALQMLRLAALIAGHDAAPALPLRHPPVLEAATWQVLQSGMRLAVRAGTAKALDPDNRLHAAAKTGTVPHGLGYRSWVIGYAPFEQPKVAFCLRAFSGTGADQAVPLLKEALGALSLP